jgi:hypothetical protein
MTLRAVLAATLGVALFATSSVRAEFGTPYITPSHPLLGETVSFNIYQGGCDGIVGADAPEVTQQGSYIYVLAQGGSIHQSRTLHAHLWGRDVRDRRVPDRRLRYAARSAVSHNRRRLRHGDVRRSEL